MLSLLITALLSQGAPRAIEGVDLSTLPPAHTQALIEILKTGPCPCDPALDLVECARRQICPEVVGLIQEAVELRRGGLEGDALADAIVDRFVDRFVVFELTAEGRPQRGPEGAPIQVTIFLDLQCPHCALTPPIIEDLMIRFAGRIRLTVKHYPLPFHLQAKPAAYAAQAAHQQGRFWEMSARIFAQQGQLDDAALLEMAEALGLDLLRFQRDRASPEVAALIEQDLREGLDALLRGTPMLYINGKPYRGPLTPQDIAEQIRASGL